MKIMKYPTAILTAVSVSLATPAMAGDFDDDKAELPLELKVEDLMDGRNAYFGDSRDYTVMRFNPFTYRVTVRDVYRPDGHLQNVMRITDYCLTEMGLIEAVPERQCANPVGPIISVNETNGNATAGRLLMGALGGSLQAFTGITAQSLFGGCNGSCEGRGSTITVTATGGAAVAEGGDAASAASAAQQQNQEQAQAMTQSQAQAVDAAGPGPCPTGGGCE